MTDLSTLREALDYIKEQSGSGSKQRKQDKFRDVYTADVGHIVTGERYDSCGIGGSTARSAAQEVFGEIPDAPTLSEALIEVDPVGDKDSLRHLVSDLDHIADLSGNEQRLALEEALESYSEPSLITLALLDDESLGLGTSQMRESFFDGSRSERKRTEALTESTVDFITRAKSDNLPDSPTPMEPFDPMLAKSESHLPDDLENHVAQLKLDGYRVLIHIIGGEARAYSRRRNDVTASLPELNEIDWPEGEFILDGEVVAADGTYSTTSSRIGKKPENIDPDTGMEFALFDVVFANADYTRRPYRERHEKLRQIDMIVPDPNVYHLDVSTDIDEVRRHAIENDYEGVIVKNPEATYRLGKRSKNWVKVKNTTETVDVVAAGFEEGEGRLTGTLGKIQIESADGVALGATGSGFSDQQREEVWQNRDHYMGEPLEVEGEAFDDAIRFPIFKRWRIDDGEADDIDRIKSILPEP